MTIKHISLAFIVAALAFAACSSSQTATQTVSSTPASGTTPMPTARNDAPSVTTAHGGNIAPASSPATSAPGSNASTTAPPTQFDEKIAKAELKAKASNATPADKQAAAAVYLERADYFRDAGQPLLYKFALGDYRRVLKYQPDNAKAKDRMNEIIAIYQSLGRSVPSNGLEP